MDVPANATLVMAVLSALYALSGQFNLLSDLSIFAVWSFYVLTFIGVIKLRKTQPNLHRPYKVPLYPYSSNNGYSRWIIRCIKPIILSWNDKYYNIFRWS